MQSSSVLVLIGFRSEERRQRTAEAGPLLVGVEPREHRIEERLVREARLVAQRDVLQAVGEQRHVVHGRGRARRAGAAGARRRRSRSRWCWRTRPARARTPPRARPSETRSRSRRRRPGETPPTRRRRARPPACTRTRGSAAHGIGLRLDRRAHGVQPGGGGVLGESVDASAGAGEVVHFRDQRATRRLGADVGVPGAAGAIRARQQQAAAAGRSATTLKSWQGTPLRTCEAPCTDAAR